MDSQQYKLIPSFLVPLEELLPWRLGLNLGIEELERLK
jgi:hypothetical protein